MENPGPWKKRPLSIVPCDKGMITGLFEQRFGILERPFTHFHILKEPWGRIFIQSEVYGAPKFLRPIRTWDALSRELVRLKMEIGYRNMKHPNDAVEGWDLSAGIDDEQLVIIAYPLWVPKSVRIVISNAEVVA